MQLIRRLARENPLWGAERIRREMLELNMRVAKSSVQKYTQDLRRISPPGQSWGTFLRDHASEIWACDFLQTYDALFRSIFVFMIIELESRRVVHVNVTRHALYVARTRTTALATGPAASRPSPVMVASVCACDKSGMLTQAAKPIHTIVISKSIRFFISHLPTGPDCGDPALFLHWCLWRLAVQVQPEDASPISRHVQVLTVGRDRQSHTRAIEQTVVDPFPGQTTIG